MAIIPQYQPGSIIEDFKRQMAVSNARDAYANRAADARKAQIGTEANYKHLPPGWDDFFDKSQRAADYASFDAGKPLSLGMGGEFGNDAIGGGGYAPTSTRAVRSGTSALDALSRGGSGNPLTDAISGDLEGRNLEGSVAKLRELGLIPQFDLGTENAEMGARKFQAQRAQLTPEDLAGEADSIDAIYGPRRAMRQAQTALQVEPYNQTLADQRLAGEGSRYWSPWNQGMLDDQQRRAIERSTAPAQIQAQGAIERAQAEAGGRVGAAQATAAGRQQDPAALISTVIGNMTSKGAFGVDRNGRPQGPPPEIQQRVGEILMDFLNGQQGRQGPSGGSTPQPGQEAVINGTPAVWGTLDGGRTYGWIAK